MNLSLFCVFSAGRIVMATFAKKHLAIRARNNINSKLKAGESPVWVGPGPDHWRVKNKDQKVPKRGPDFMWTKAIEPADFGVLTEIKPDEWLNWYTSRREEGFA